MYEFCTVDISSLSKYYIVYSWCCRNFKILEVLFRVSNIIDNTSLAVDAGLFLWSTALVTNDPARRFSTVTNVFWFLGSVYVGGDVVLANMVAIVWWRSPAWRQQSVARLHVGKSLLLLDVRTTSNNLTYGRDDLLHDITQSQPVRKTILVRFSRWSVRDVNDKKKTKCRRITQATYRRRWWPIATITAATNWWYRRGCRGWTTLDTDHRRPSNAADCTNVCDTDLLLIIDSMKLGLMYE